MYGQISPFSGTGELDHVQLGSVIARVGHKQSVPQPMLDCTALLLKWIGCL